MHSTDAVTFVSSRRYSASIDRERNMKKLTKAEVFARFQTVLAILGEEDCEEAQADVRLKNVRILFERASRAPEVKLDDVANDAGSI